MTEDTTDAKNLYFFLISLSPPFLFIVVCSVRDITVNT